MEKKSDRRGLGRGLSALMADVSLDQATSALGTKRRGDIFIPIEQIAPNADQPRRNFDSVALEQLADSIRKKGVIQPLIVRKMAVSKNYQIVAGERRWRAAQIAGLHELPVIIREFSDVEVLEISIIENIQRAELNAIEEALAYRQLMQRFGHSQEKIAEVLSRSRSHIANHLRLLSLPEDVQAYVKEGKITAGHARALITTGNASELAKQVVLRGLSVRETEDLVRQSMDKTTNVRTTIRQKQKDADTRSLETDLSANLGMSVRIDHQSDGLGGKLSISYRSLEDLDLLCRALSFIPRDMAKLG